MNESPNNPQHNVQPLEPRPRSTGMLGVLAVLFLVAGGLTIFFGVKYAQRRGSAGSVNIVDTSYQRVPADSSQPWLKEFTLVERNGKSVNSGELLGQPYVSSFFFATCPAYCMQQNEKMAGVAKEYGPKGVKFLSISVDPENDTPAKLREYAHRFNADDKSWLFLTGDQTYIGRVGAEIYTVSAGKQTHSEKLIVSDKWGNIRGRYYWKEPAEMLQLKQLLDELLVEKEPPAEFAEKKA